MCCSPQWNGNTTDNVLPPPQLKPGMDSIYSYSVTLTRSMDCRRQLTIDIKPSDSLERKRFLKVVAIIYYKLEDFIRTALFSMLLIHKK